MDTKLLGILEAMRSAHDRDISAYDAGFLAKTIQKRIALTGCLSAADYSALLPGSRDEAEELAAALNNSHSAFFRNPLTFALLEQLILPAIRVQKEAAGVQEIRVWSAACACGEEAYSLAILIEDMAGAHGGQLPYRIFATDVSEENLGKARHGIYNVAALQEVRQRHLCDYFKPSGDGWRVDARLRDRVAFSRYDLLDERTSSPPPSVFGEFDLVMCSNLLFYYRQDVRQFMLQKIHRALASDGFLVTGEAERNILESHAGFRAVAPPAAVFRKIHSQAAALAAQSAESTSS